MADDATFLPRGPQPLIGDDFHLVGALGRVGDGIVYNARGGLRQARLREYAPPGVVRRVADGTLHPADARLAEAWRDGTTRFLEQGHKLVSVDHFGVAPVWRAMSIEQDGVRQGAYLIGAPVGEPLGAALAAGLQIPPAQVIRIAQDLGDALAEIHGRGITHLDISPQTVSIAAGFVELTDFAVDNRPFMALLESQQGLVRPGYSPIEHHDASMAEPLGPPADVYAASALLFRLVTGRDPAPWQERWRDPSSAELDDRDAYPPAFIEAIRKGLAIEPEDRFRDGAEWLAAMGFAAPQPVTGGRLATLDQAVTVPFDPAEAPPPPPSRPVQLEPVSKPGRRKVGAWLIPLLFLLALLVIVVGGYIAYKQRWFVFDEQGESDTNGSATRSPAGKTARERAPLPPEVAIGGTVSGQLAGRDPRRPGGQLEDRFLLRGNSGDRVELRLSSEDFDPLVSIAGPGLSAANDDDSARGTRNSRLVLTLPRAGAYTISVSSASRGASGNYLLEVASPRPQISIATPAMLAGRWRTSADPTCEIPVTIVIEGDVLVADLGEQESRERILDGIGRTIRTRNEQGAEGGYVIAEDGDSFERSGRTWLRC